MTNTPQIVDSHCHLDFPDFADELGDVIDRAVASGVARMVTICTKLRLAPRVWRGWSRSAQSCALLNRCAPLPINMRLSSGPQAPIR